MQRYVSAVGATTAARELGISRSRVYQLLAAAADDD
jgi:DNA-directed RNA polymerase specialized sigma subunit